LKPIVLVLLDHYLPGFKSGGPLRSVANLVEQLDQAFEFKIITSDRDLGDSSPYACISVDSWNTAGKALVHYASPKNFSQRGITRLIRETPHDVLYLNSFFSYRATVLPLLARRFGRIPDKSIVLAPRGEFSPGALAQKTFKKKTFIFFSKALGLYSRIRWQASSCYEADDIRREMGLVATDIKVACDLPTAAGQCPHQASRQAGDPLQIAFLSRIAPKKNLAFALDCLANVKVPVHFGIWGPAEDAVYWLECQRKIERLPGHISAQYHGPAHPNEVPHIMASNDLFFLPTLGENYGHVIAEAFCAGTPVLISDATPWRQLADQGLGRDFPLGDTEPFAEYINTLALLSSAEYSHLRARVLVFARKMQDESEDIRRNEDLFLGALCNS